MATNSHAKIDLNQVKLTVVELAKVKEGYLIKSIQFIEVSPNAKKTDSADIPNYKFENKSLYGVYANNKIFCGDLIARDFAKEILQFPVGTIFDRHGKKYVAPVKLESRTYALTEKFSEPINAKSKSRPQPAEVLNYCRQLGVPLETGAAYFDMQKLKLVVSASKADHEKLLAELERLGVISATVKK